MHSTKSFTETLRLAELHSAMAHFEAASALLEIGAGTGWQARELHRLGFKVEAVDIPDGTYTADRIWPVRNYDGRHLPFPDGSFDAVFSSNVLEHVEDLHEHLIEQLRVLKPGGRMIHIMPTPVWRFWTSLTYYPERALRHLGNTLVPARTASSAPGHPAPPSGRGIGVLWAPAHGVDKSPIAELWRFGRARWMEEFSRLPVVELRSWPAGLFYSGYLLFGRALSINSRRALTRILGSSCRVFSMRKS